MDIIPHLPGGDIYMVPFQRRAIQPFLNSLAGSRKILPAAAALGGIKGAGEREHDYRFYPVPLVSSSGLVTTNCLLPPIFFLMRRPLHTCPQKTTPIFPRWSLKRWKHTWNNIPINLTEPYFALLPPASSFSG